MIEQETVEFRIAITCLDPEDEPPDKEEVEQALLDYFKADYHDVTVEQA